MDNKILWSFLVQLGMAMWPDRVSKTLKFDRKLWYEFSKHLADCGCNCVCLDIGEGLIYDSHPEIAADGAFTKDEMREEIKRLNSLGIEIIPKLNFSACHDMWMGKYSRMVSTDEYYQFCKDVIDETCKLFKPRYFHIGMDEENYELEKTYDYVVIRQNELWWHDLRYLADCVEKNGARAIIWADYARHYPEIFAEKLPKSVIASVWNYNEKIEGEDMTDFQKNRSMPFDVCKEHGFDQLPAGSNFFHEENFELLSAYCARHLNDEHLIGIMQTVWYATDEEHRDKLWESAALFKKGKELFDSMV